LLKGKEKVGGEFDLICLSYNIRRSVSILCIKELISGLKALKTDFFGFVRLFLVNFKLIGAPKVEIIGLKKDDPGIRCYSKYP